MILLRYIRFVIFAVLLSGVARAAIACELDPFLFQLSGETVEQAEVRSNAVLSDHRVVRHFRRETYDWEKATVVYLARVLSNNQARLTAEERVLPSSRVEPLRALKGKLPTGEQILTDERQTGMCSDVGDGEGSFAKPGELVVVFKGLPHDQHRPRGIDSFRAMSIRTTDILDRLRQFGKDLE